MRRLLLTELSARRRSLAGLSLGVLLLLLVMAGSYTAYGGASRFNAAFGGRNQPPLFAAIAGAPHVDLFAPRSFLAFGFEHPLTLLLVLVAVVGPGIAAVAGDVESRRAELVYTAPVRRSAIYDARLFMAGVSALVVTAAGVLGAELGRWLSSDLRSVPMQVPVVVAVHLLALVTCFIGLSFAVSAGARSRAEATGVTVAIVAGSYLINIIALLWWPLRWVTNIDAFHYFQPTEAATKFRPMSLIVLILTGALFALVGRVLLNRRDLA